jgi:hemin uptake protein HemP
MHESVAAESEIPSVQSTEVSVRPGVRRLLAEALFGAARELVIEHGGDEYRLRITQAGKLILTK